MRQEQSLHRHLRWIKFSPTTNSQLFDQLYDIQSYTLACTAHYARLRRRGIVGKFRLWERKQTTLDIVAGSWLYLKQEQEDQALLDLRDCRSKSWLVTFLSFFLRLRLVECLSMTEAAGV